MPTDQETFDTVARHLLQQNAKALLSPNGNICVYRGPNNTKCAVGCLIPDELYTPEFESVRPTENYTDNNRRAVELTETLKGLGYTNIRLLRELQVIHDFYEPSMWPEHLCALAERYHLDTTVLDNSNA